MITIIVGIVCFFVGAEVECYLWKREGEKTRALVKELADMLEKADRNIGTYRGEFQRNYIHKKCCELIAKAREVAK